jgi:putative membrane protein
MIDALMKSKGPSSYRDGLVLYLKGMLMGIADLIPGVSGGTIAFITGIYDDVLGGISSYNISFVKKFFSRDFKLAIEESSTKFLIVLFSGILTSVFLFARLMHFLMNNYAVFTWSLFFGLIIASIFTLFKSTKNVFGFNLVWLFLGGAFAYTVVSLVPVTTPESNLFIFFCGFISIMAMILPGLSGSFLLLILGKYQFITGAIKNPFNAENIIIMGVFATGATLGLTLFSRFLKYLLNKFHDQTMIFLVGVLIGSLKKVWPWKKTLESVVIRGKTKILSEEHFIPTKIDSEVVTAIGLMLVGFLIVFFMERVAEVKSEK